MTDADFLPADYEVPKAITNYTKLEAGDNRLRILTKPILGWSTWMGAGKDRKPVRFPMDRKPDKPIQAGERVNHFWAFVVYNYTHKCIQVMEITQKTIQDAIRVLSKDADWGPPYHYDIKIVKTGTTKDDTEYKTNPCPKSPLTEELKSAFLAKPCSLAKMYKGEEAFDLKEGELRTQLEDMPF